MQVKPRYGYTLHLADGTRWNIRRCVLCQPDEPELGMFPTAATRRDPMVNRGATHGAEDDGDDTRIAEREGIAPNVDRSDPSALEVIPRRSERTRKQTEFFEFSG